MHKPLPDCKIDFDFFTKAEYPEATSCTKHQLHELKDIHDEYGGFPESYNFENTQIRQRWWTEDEVDFKHIGDQIGMDVVTLSSILQPPGCTIPWHRDTFFLIKKNHANKLEQGKRPVRALCMAEDWQMGHFVQLMDDVWTHWKQGQVYVFDEECLHLGANCGFTNKFTLQISGFLHDDIPAK